MTFAGAVNGLGRVQMPFATVVVGLEAAGGAGARSAGGSVRGLAVGPPAERLDCTGKSPAQPPPPLGLLQVALGVGGEQVEDRRG